MSLSAAVIRELVGAGLSGAALVSACERIEADAPPPVVYVDEQAVRRREADRARKAAKRLRNSAESADNAEIKEVPHTPPENPSPKEKTLREKKKPVSRIPDDFQPDLDWAVSQGLSRAQASTQAATFRDFWTGAKDGAKADWPATWRNWVRKFIERAGISPRPEPQSDDEQWRKRLVYARQARRWGEEWGPLPGDPNCRAPPGLLEPGDGSGWVKWESAA